VAKAAETGMSMYYLNLFSNDDIAKYWEEGEHGWKCRGAVNDKEWDVIHLQAIREVSYTRSLLFVGVSDDYNLVATINQFRRQLIDMAFDTSRLGKEEVADHGNAVRHD
jgi:hypothetical protein